MIKEENKIYSLSGDLMFKNLFGTKRNAKFTEDLLEAFFDLGKGTLKGLEITNSVKLDRNTIDLKKFELDVMVKLKNGESINLEMYRKYDKNSEIKSFMYITGKFSEGLERSEDYSLAKKVTQLNFVKENRVHKNKSLIDKYMIINSDKISDSILPELFQIYIINLDVEELICYNNVNKDLKNWIDLMRSETTEEILAMKDRSEIIREAVEEMSIFSKKKEVQNYHSKEVLIRSQHNSELKETKENTKLEIAKSMLKSGIDIKDIIKIVGLEEDKINDLAKDMNIEQSQYSNEVLIKSQHNSELKEIKENTKLEIAKSMLKDGLSIETIVKYTNLTKEEVLKLQEEI